MEYRRFGSKILVRMDKGDEICEKMLELAKLENIKLASVTGIGAANDLVLGVFDTDKKQYHKTHLCERTYEIASMMGTLSTMKTEPYLHLHAVIGSPYTSDCHGGHLNSAICCATAEIVVDIIDGEVDREFSEEIGLNLFKF